MKTYLSILIFMLVTYSSQAQHDIYGNYYEDSLLVRPVVQTVRTITHQGVFETPKEDEYIYHMVAEGETIESILNMYQLCAPCFTKWNNYTYSSLESLKREKLYEGEYLKVALKEQYYKGFISNPVKKYNYLKLDKRLSVYKIARRYGVSESQLKTWNKLNEYTYNLEAGTTLIVNEKVYKYVCPCKETND
ncbi:LysM peptidoglycan-binding domain-containing protein [Bernardetia sp.]|uniref:LysM peptidoglycan-binding domain-containing protein n=1 Tax=Bernardetia sp. TaxID=1937974 RepID=UPI0025BF4754|nr:LysM peptidoglycan-binding domain-containing protein [Bernardetia sp.]